SNRELTGNSLVVRTACPACCAIKVIAALRADRAKSGSFSTTSDEKGSAVVFLIDLPSGTEANSRALLSGQTSSRSRANGKMITWGLASKATRYNTATEAWPLVVGLRTCREYAHVASRKNNTLSTVLRSAAQATASTFKGCTANRTANIQLRPAKPVIVLKIRKSSTAFSACKRTFSK